MASFTFRFTLPGGETGKSPKISIVRLSDHYLFDFNDNTFKASGWVTPEATMVELKTGLTSPPARLDGEYAYGWTIPTVKGVVGYEALFSEVDTGEDGAQQLWAVDSHVEHNSQVLVTLTPGTVTPWSEEQVRLAILSLVMGDMDQIDSNSVRFKSPNGQVFVTFARAQVAGEWTRTRQ